MGWAEIHLWALHVQIWDIVKGFLLGCDISFSHPLLLNIYPRVRVSGSHSIMSNIFASPWTVAHQAPLSMEFPRQEYWSG